MSDNFKKEAADSVDQMKDMIKNVNIEEEAKRTKGFFKDMIANPIGTIKTISKNSQDYFSIALILLIVWAIASFLQQILFTVSNLWHYSFSFGNLFKGIFNTIFNTLSPIFIVAAMVIAMQIILKKKIQKIKPVFIVVIISFIPQVIASIINIFSAFVFSVGNIVNPYSGRLSIYFITNPINSLLYVISFVLLYFGLKALSEESEDESFFKKYVCILGVYFIIALLLGGLLGISM